VTGLAIAALLFAAAPDFRADFPTAEIALSRDGKSIERASKFSAPGLGRTCAQAALAFLERYGASFGLASESWRAKPDAAPARVSFERAIDGLPVFERTVIVGCDDEATVVLMTAPAVPPRAGVGFVVGRASATIAAKHAVGDHGGARFRHTSAKGWYVGDGEILPAWQIELSGSDGMAAWRVYVDAARGTVLSKTSLGTTASAPM